MCNPSLGVDLSEASAQAVWTENSVKWPFVGSPWRPSEGDVAIYRRFADGRLAGRVLVLGATPELRDLAAEHAGPTRRPVIVDMSRPMLEAMSRLAKRARPDDETWRVADWCDVELDEHSFDLILADMIWWTVPVRRQTMLRDRIARLLAPHGRFVSRFRMLDPARLRDDPHETTARFLAWLDAGDAPEQRIRDAWLSCLYDTTADIVHRRMDRERVRALIGAMRNRTLDATHRRFFDVSLTRLVGADWTSQPRCEIYNSLREAFVVEGEACAPDYDAGAYPVLALRGHAVR